LAVVRATVHDAKRVMAELAQGARVAVGQHAGTKFKTGLAFQRLGRQARVKSPNSRQAREAPISVQSVHEAVKTRYS